MAPVRLEDSDGDRAPSTLSAQPVDSPRIGLLRPAAKALGLSAKGLGIGYE